MIRVTPISVLIALTVALITGGIPAVAGAVGPLVFDAPVNASTDIYRLRLNGVQIEILDDSTAVVLASRLLADTDTVMINGETLEADTLIVDFSGGNPIPPLGLDYSGGDSFDGNGLELEGGSFTAIEHVFPEPPPGESVLTTGSILLDTSVINYRELRLRSVPLIDRVAATDRAFTPEFLSPSATWRIGDDQGTIAGLSGLTEGFSAQEAVLFTNPSGAITFNLRDEFDSVTIRPFETSFTAAVTIVGGPGDDELHLFDEDLSAGTDMTVDLVNAATGEADVGGLTFPLSIRGIESVAVSILGTGVFRLTGTSGADAVTLMDGPFFPERIFFNGSPPLNPGSAGGGNGPDLELTRYDLLMLDGGDPATEPGDDFLYLGDGVLTGTPVSGTVEGIGSEVAFANFESTETGLPAVFVDHSAPPGGDGSTWATAFDTVQEGVTAAEPGPLPVWVADGSYVETVTMGDNVRLLGGFTGLGASEEILERDRDPDLNVTILNGGGAGPVILFDNVQGAELDGFTVTAGFASDGAGVLISGGGGVRFNSVIDCTVVDNLADGGHGGGIHVTAGADVGLFDCRFIGNSAPGFGLGGGVGIDGGATVTVSGCLFAGNVSFAGGGLGLNDNSTAFVRQSIFSGNTSVAGGGIFESASFTRAASCLISGNRATFRGGGIRVQESINSDYLNCTVARNAAGDGGGMSLDLGASPDLLNTLFEGNSPLAVLEESAADDPLVQFCLFDSNVGGDYGDFDTGLVVNGVDVNTLDSNTDNIAGDPDFVGGLSGTWSAGVPVYSAATNRTTLFVDSPVFEPDSLFGRIINPDTTQLLEAVITGNSAVSVEVVGDLVTGPLSLTGGETFELVDYHMGSLSDGIDAGTEVISSSSDLDNVDRPFGPEYDIGAYEAHPELTLSTNSVDFSDWDIDDGPSPTMTLSLANVGTLPLNFEGTGISIVGGSFPDDFAVVGTPDAMPIAPRSSREVDLTFDPSGINLRSAALEVRTDDIDEPLTVIALSGAGFVSTVNLAGRLVGLFGLPVSPDQADVNADGLIDSADIVANVNSGR